MSFPKHGATGPRKGKKQPQPPQPQQPLVLTGPTVPTGIYPSTPSIQHDINHVSGLGDVATHLDWIGDAVARLTHDDHSVGVSVCQNQYGGPIQLTLVDNDEEDTLDRLVTAMERIADSVAKLAGLTRPRLEEWHHQDDYEPRYHDAPGGEAPGPKAVK